ncbi:MAG TPA: hypothetical protein VN041_13905 [Microbacterium sp.]|nr:hypothetical protein [Microbacterium sp.]
MTRKDGRPLVTEHRVTGFDMIDYIAAEDLPPLDTRTACVMRREPVDESWMEPDEGPGDDFDIGEWGA